MLPRTNRTSPTTTKMMPIVSTMGMTAKYPKGTWPFRGTYCAAAIWLTQALTVVTPSSSGTATPAEVAALA